MNNGSSRNLRLQKYRFAAPLPEVFSLMRFVHPPRRFARWGDPEVTDRRTIRAFDIVNGSSETLLATADGALDRPHASPDDRWIAFRRSGKTFVTRLATEQPPSEQTWAQVEEPTTTGRPMGWSLNSDLVYLLLDTDGFRCVYAQRIDTAPALCEARRTPPLFRGQSDRSSRLGLLGHA